MYLRQVDVWARQIGILQAVAQRLIGADRVERARWHILLEYEIPRRLKRPDAILLAEDVVFVMEFKEGTVTFDAAAKWQVEDYALDLRDFHSACHGVSIVPVLCVTHGPKLAPSEYGSGQTVWPVQLANAESLAEVIDASFAAAHDAARPALDALKWSSAPYRPALTIVEAAERLYRGHDVRDISHNYADNLQATSERVVAAVQEAQTRNLRLVCFVTGVPGAGKTLAGLNVVHEPVLRQGNRPPGVFLSGNGPLVRIVREALVRSCVRSGSSRRQAEREVQTFIQNVHAFLDNHVAPGAALPPEHVAIFDEAQRAWNAKQVYKKRRIAASEPELMLSVMARKPGWCVIVALVGGGQEIHLGEAGLAEWGRALSRSADAWTVFASPNVLEGTSAEGCQRLFDTPPRAHLQVIAEPALHLSVSVRSPRARSIARWVDAVLAARPDVASQYASGMRDFPLAVTRELSAARLWLRQRSRGDPFLRSGLLASSGALRHRAYGLELSSGFRKGYEYRHWFLAGPDDLRSSYALEVASTEFECQGLELDWTGVCWGDDLLLDATGAWTLRKLVGNHWCVQKGSTARQYLLNKYRVLLTRARQGMVIWVPPGEASDPTRDPVPLGRVYNLLRSAGALPYDGEQ
jgi:hypothetical protein